MIKLQLNQVCIGVRNYKCLRVPDSPNKKMHWAIKHKWTKAWQSEVGWAVIKNRHKLGKLPLLKPQICVLLRLCKLRDKDNLYASVKAVVDGLTLAGVIEDDSPKYIDLTVKQEKVAHRKDEGIDIIIG